VHDYLSCVKSSGRHSADQQEESIVSFNQDLPTFQGHTKSSMGLIIWSLLSRRLVVVATTKPNLGHLAPASEVAGGHTIPF
jgi:hypothetical protein